MNTRQTAARLSIIALLLGIAQQGAIASLRSDLVPPQKRRVTVTLAEGLTEVRGGMEVPGDLINPFNPPDFDGPPAGEAKGPRLAGSAASLTPIVRGDREIVEALALRFPAGGAMIRGGKMLLTSGPKQYETGQVLLLSYDGRDYEVEVVAITTTTFTLRYRAEESTRPFRGSR